jgi:NADH dehydrogenase
MSGEKTQAVTGAFGYSGKHITSRLLSQGQRVLTLTNSGQRANPFGDQVRALPFHFDDPSALARSLENVDVLYNTYWVRFNHKLFRHQDAVQNTLTLFKAAKEAGVRRVVHVSITNPSASSPLEYFRGKAVLEKALIESGLSYAILRPTVIFGREDILINNIAWAVRHLPVFGVFGDGQYRLQPIYVDDLADLAVRCGAGNENQLIDAIGPETYTYRELAQTIARLIGVRRLVIGVPPHLGWLAGQALGWLTKDVVITQEEIEGLMADLLYTPSLPTGTTRLSEWIQANAQTLGRHYTSELARRVDRQTAYASN